VQAKNRLEWALAQIGGMFQNATVVGFYDTLDDEAIKHMVRQTELTTMLMESKYVPKLLELACQDS